MIARKPNYSRHCEDDRTKQSHLLLTNCPTAAVRLYLNRNTGRALEQVAFLLILFIIGHKWLVVVISPPTGLMFLIFITFTVISSLRDF